MANLILPFIVDDASGVTDPPTKDETNSVVAICVVLVPTAAVGAEGMPVNVGEAMVALNAISFVFVVTLLSIEVILDVLLAILFVFDVTLASSEVILEVLDEILLSKVVSAVVALEVSEVKLAFVVLMLVVNPASAFVALVTSEVKLAFVELIFVCKVFSEAVALVVSEVKLALVELILVVNKASAFVALVVSAVMLAVFDAISVGKVVIVEELTPPILFTTGALAVPPKSFDNCNFPFTVALASATDALVT